MQYSTNTSTNTRQNSGDSKKTEYEILCATETFDSVCPFVLLRCMIECVFKAEKKEKWKGENLNLCCRKSQCHLPIKVLLYDIVSIYLRTQKPVCLLSLYSSLFKEIVMTVCEGKGSALTLCWLPAFIALMASFFF